MMYKLKGGTNMAHPCPTKWRPEVGLGTRLGPTTFPNKLQNLVIGSELNRGAWGVVYNGELKECPVAVERVCKPLLQEASENI